MNYVQVDPEEFQSRLSVLNDCQVQVYTMYYVQVDPEEFQSRLSVLKDWMSEFSDVQKLALLQGITITRLFFYFK